ncbi:hypothetical protein N0V90_005086 [Kalmusia sp. IMI 367209]|nr:hypothetical protein N0V90_005086 [Kalmusia sp. IMI 367209]
MPTPGPEPVPNRLPAADDAVADRPFRFVYFAPKAEIPEEDYASIIEIFRRLPAESIVGQFARGTRQDPPPGAAQTEVYVFKTWHQWESCWNHNEHFSVSLEWVNEARNLVAGGKYANAHLHMNGLEFIFEHATANKLCRPVGRLTYDTYTPQSQHPPQQNNQSDLALAVPSFTQDLLPNAPSTSTPRHATPALPPSRPWDQEYDDSPYQDLDEVEEAKLDLEDLY